MKRVTDKPNLTYTVYNIATTTGICVKCPKCKGLGIVTVDKMEADTVKAYFKCTNCGTSKEKNQTLYLYDIENLCECCERYYRIGLTDESQQHFHILRVACPYCGHAMCGEVRKKTGALCYCNEIKNTCEPYFGFELWFLTYLNNKCVWAMNREHLAYLIEYLSADLREKPIEVGTMRTQADHLPTFMKTAKNRNKIVKLLENMQRK